MSIALREMTEEDQAVWAEMRSALWPFTSAAENREDIARILAAPDMWGFIAIDEKGAPAGFAEVALRRYANGCEASPVPFLEGLWVSENFRRRGVGEALVAHVARELREKGFRELCSDALLENKVSHAAHEAWGFTETERVVYFRKALT